MLWRWWRRRDGSHWLRTAREQSEVRLEEQGLAVWLARDPFAWRPWTLSPLLHLSRCSQEVVDRRGYTWRQSAARKKYSQQSVRQQVRSSLPCLPPSSDDVGQSVSACSAEPIRTGVNYLSKYLGNLLQTAGFMRPLEALSFGRSTLQMTLMLHAPCLDERRSLSRVSRFK